ncbi:AraC family transcriptional regulator [Phyllobacterium sp. SB3]|uniref:helix-turn-helix transcriptional regulator n=1 Tax=Phyllobacterium sp. SB3 TaxID=3156073 RepID=UPI0032AF780B
MGKIASDITGEFSLSDLLRAAAERSITVDCQPDVNPGLDTATMSGSLKAEEVQPGLLMSGYDITYLADSAFSVGMERSLVCAVLLDGKSEPMHVDGYAPVVHEPKHAAIIGFGEPTVCRRPWRTGQRTRAFGITVKPVFFERFGDMLDGEDLAPIQDFLNPGFHAANLPWSQKIIEIAEDVLSHPYGGKLRTLYHESHALRFILEVAIALRDERRIVQNIGRLQYDRAHHAREILDRSLTDPPKSLNLAKQVGVNVTTLQANFKAVFGTTIFGYVRTQRLKMSRILILEHGLRIAEAGNRVGFSNAAAFTAAYRRHFGHPPTGDVGH